MGYTDIPWYTYQLVSRRMSEPSTVSTPQIPIHFGISFGNLRPTCEFLNGLDVFDAISPPEMAR